ncbi:S4 domain-containing protein [Tanticharoenia sakaeratensis]|uniref:Heat shock protein n=1 Tax=Tanticharoenia sakaeratensis NBRC 103193 TaxID=1231623 RepID=A0A0D6MKT3_9PROT|nr:S4 domain-containing protein [Tanticharoenia sakaeratensis]GAN53883.1 heat shock protein [Tanticharoenia sakaeratensis NBRC 103193]GBQ25166.1 heat shock protein [Tanticharoenia sakaeratensis NBRC 103193]
MRKEPDTGVAPSQRLDLWLWHARIARTRSACTAFVQQGRIRINRMETDKPHARVRVGDVLTLPAHPSPEVRVLRVLALVEKRGSPRETIGVYEEL